MYDGLNTKVFCQAGESIWQKKTMIGKEIISYFFEKGGIAQSL